MATYRQLRESLGIHEGLAKSRKEADPGDIWQVKKNPSKAEFEPEPPRVG